MGHSFDMLTFDFLLKPPQPFTGLFFRSVERKQKEKEVEDERLKAEKAKREERERQERRVERAARDRSV